MLRFMLLTIGVCTVFNWEQRKRAFAMTFIINSAGLLSNLITYFIQSRYDTHLLELISSIMLITILPICAYFFFIYDPLEKGIIQNEQSQIMSTYFPEVEWHGFEIGKNECYEVRTKKTNLSLNTFSKITKEQNLEPIGESDCFEVLVS